LRSRDLNIQSSSTDLPTLGWIDLVKSSRNMCKTHRIDERTGESKIRAHLDSDEQQLAPVY